MKSLKDASILITGGGSGLGRGAAQHFVRRGAKVTICGRRKEKIDAVANELGPNCLAVRGDITIADDRAEIVDAAVGHGNGLFALINNAGNMYRGPIEELQEDQLLEIFHSNVIAGMMLSGLAVPHLEKTQGSILFLGSTHTRRAIPGASPYAASKAAVQGLSRVLAAELGPKKIRVNCILPGAVFTEINQRAGLFDDETARKRLEGMSDVHALGRIGTEEEIAEAAEYLLRAQWTTGAIVDVDGGFGLGILKA
jgi:3-oxoacyl-[acyl-carrier protein] reductase